MTEANQSPIVPALVGGIAAGVLSSLPLLGCFCCLWIIGGAMVSVNLYAKTSPRSLTSGDGAIVGIFSGIAAAVAASVVNLAFQPANREMAQRLADQFARVFPNMAPEWDSVLRSASMGMSPARFLLGLLIQAAVFSVFGALGGIIGASIFGRRSHPPVPGPPPAAPQS